MLASFFVSSAASAASLPSAPTLIAPATTSVVVENSPVITGVAHSELQIAVYIDDVFNGYAELVSEANGVQSFAYEPFLPLGAGEHTVMVRAEDLDAGTRSKKSKVTTFTVAQALSAPTVLDTVVNAESSVERPFIVGVAPAGTEVDIWINGYYAGSTMATDHKSGTGSFAFRAPWNLSNGYHSVKATSTETEGLGRTSGFSRTVSLLSTAPATESVATESTSREIIATDVTEEATAERAENLTEQEETEEFQSTEEENAETADEESGEESDEDETEEGAATTKEDEDDGLGFLGWAALLVVAAIVVARARRRRSGTATNVSFSPSSESGEDHGDGKGQLDLNVSKENKNITVIKHDTSDSESNDSNDQA